MPQVQEVGRGVPTASRLLAAKRGMATAQFSVFELSNLQFGNSSHDRATNDFLMPRPGRTCAFCRG
jgi:hypothetical protein